MTPDHLAAVLAALDAATEAEARMSPGEWRECGHDRGGCKCGIVWAVPADVPVLTTDTDSEADGFSSTHERKFIDAAGIALARNQWPALLRLARAVAEHIAARRAEADERNAHPDNLASPESRARSFAAMRAMDAALLALAPDTEGD